MISTLSMVKLSFIPTPLKTAPDREIVKLYKEHGDENLINLMYMRHFGSMYEISKGYPLSSEEKGSISLEITERSMRCFNLEKPIKFLTYLLTLFKNEMIKKISYNKTQSRIINDNYAGKKLYIADMIADTEFSELVPEDSKLSLLYTYMNPNEASRLIFHEDGFENTEIRLIFKSLTENEQIFNVREKQLLQHLMDDESLQQAAYDLDWPYHKVLRVRNSIRNKMEACNLKPILTV